jgi:hypothetical protein
LRAAAANGVAALPGRSCLDYFGNINNRENCALHGEAGEMHAQTCSMGCQYAMMFTTRAFDGGGEKKILCVLGELLFKFFFRFWFYRFSPLRIESIEFW